MISPHAGGPFVEQATAAPGELRQLAPLETPSESLQNIRGFALMFGVAEIAPAVLEAIDKAIADLDAE